MGVRSLCELLKQQRNRPLALVVADYGAWKNLLGFDPVGLLNFELNSAEAQVLKLGVGVAAHLRIRILGWIDELVANVAVAGAEFIEQAEGFGLKTLESRREVPLEVNRHEHGLLNLVDEGFGRVAEAKALVCSKVQADKDRAKG